MSVFRARLDDGVIGDAVGLVLVRPKRPTINKTRTLVILVSRRVLHPSGKGVGMQNTSQIMIFGAILKKPF